ncbi:MAG: hypothetical protein ACRCUP_01000 [Mycoplasmatales bacterium]
MIELLIASFEKEIFSGQVEQFTMLTTAGEMTLLPGHIPILSTFNNGYINVNGQMIAIEEGTISFNNDKAHIIVAK